MTTPSKSRPQKSNHDFEEKYSKCLYWYICINANQGYLDQTRLNCFDRQRLEYKKAHNAIEFGKMVKMNIVVEKWLHSLIGEFSYPHQLLKAILISKIPVSKYSAMIQRWLICFGLYSVMFY